MTDIICIAVIFAALVVCFLVNDRIYQERLNRIALIKWAAERAEKPLDRAPLVVHNKIGEN